MGPHRFKNAQGIACAHRKCPHTLNGIRLVRLKSTSFHSGSSPHTSQSTVLQSHNAAIQHRRECQIDKVLQLNTIESATSNNNRKCYDSTQQRMQSKSSFNATELRLVHSGSSSHVGQSRMQQIHTVLQLNKIENATAQHNRK